MSLALMSCADPNPNAVTVTHMGVKAFGDTTTIPVRSGDTVYIMAERLGVDMRALIDSNNLVPPYDILPGQRLRVPTPPVIQVQEGDTLYSIARAYNADQSELVRLNNLSRPYQLAYGQQIKLPSVPVSSAAIVTKTQNAAPVLVDEPVYDMGKISSAPAGNISDDKSRDGTSILPPLAAAPSLVDLPAPGSLKEPLAPAAKPVSVASKPPASKSANSLGTGVPNFSWPVNGSVLSDFGPKAGGRHNDGLNIGAPLGSPVRAAAAGEVVYTGNKVAGFGNLILVRHSGGFASAYAHVQNPLIARGDKIAAGQTIASIGKTGNVSTPQLHFEIRKGTRAVNPKTYLP